MIRVGIWLLAVALAAAGGFFATAFLGALCEDVGSAGSDTYCRHGGMEAAWVAVLGAFAWELLVPAAGLLLKSQSTFVAGVAVPVVAIPVVVGLALAFGTG